MFFHLPSIWTTGDSEYSEKFPSLTQEVLHTRYRKKVLHTLTRKKNALHNWAEQFIQTVTRLSNLFESISCPIFTPPTHVPCQLIGQASYMLPSRNIWRNSARKCRGDLAVIFQSDRPGIWRRIRSIFLLTLQLICLRAIAYQGSGRRMDPCKRRPEKITLKIARCVTAKVIGSSVVIVGL